MSLPPTEVVGHVQVLHLHLLHPKAEIFELTRQDQGRIRKELGLGDKYVKVWVVEHGGFEGAGALLNAVDVHPGLLHAFFPGFALGEPLEPEACVEGIVLEASLLALRHVSPALRRRCLRLDLLRCLLTFLRLIAPRARVQAPGPAERPLHAALDHDRDTCGALMNVRKGVPGGSPGACFPRTGDEKSTDGARRASGGGSPGRYVQIAGAREAAAASSSLHA
eukprot:scaffold48_cov311-Pinguiococcus_pyrenoidosus.AAC.240